MKSSVVRADARRRGIALLVVLLTLLALFALCAPFLWLATSVDEASNRLADRTRTRLALEEAARHARYQLAASHPSIDATRDFDSLAEFDAPFEFGEGFFDRLDEGGVMWDHSVEDLAGRVDLSSASPQLVANLLGVATYVTQAVSEDGEEIQVGDASGFPDAGYLYIDGEYIAYDRRDGNRFVELTRGLFNNGTNACGPRPASSHDSGATVLGMQAVVFAQWRMARGMKEARAMGFGELGDELRGLLPPPRTASDAEPDDGLLQLPVDPLEDVAEVFDRTATLYGDIAASRRWQFPTRIINDLTAGASCVLQVEELRWCTPGSTVRIRGEGGAEEFGLVRAFARGAAIVLEEPVRNAYTGRHAVVEVLSRRPVNVNTANRDVLEALFENVSLLGVTSRVNRTEARELADKILEMRPFEGFEDLLERLLLPAAGIPLAKEGEKASDARQRYERSRSMEPFLDIEDVVALYKNARNANDSDLSFSTAPFSFTSRDVFAIDLRASLNVESGRQRYAAAREQIEWVAPPGELIQVWGRQSDYDEELRLDRFAPGWVTGPTPVAVFDGRFGADPPPRTLAHLAISRDADGEAPVSRTVFASEDPDGYVRPWVSRSDDAGPRQGRSVHFDRTRSDLEGHSLAEQTLSYDPQTGPAGWVDGNGLLQPCGVQFWFKENAASGHLLDCGTGSPENDRLHLFHDGGELVLEVLDAVGDHPDTTFEERARVALPLAGSPVSPGLWSHVEIDVRGTRPDELSMRVDGFGFGRPQSTTSMKVRGLTFLASPLSSSDTEIVVESTEGFPDRCVLLIGNELAEAVRTGPTTFDAQAQLTGQLAGFGGRLARELFQYRQVGDSVELVNQSVANKSGSYPVGTQVQLYGYSTMLASEVPPGSASLDGPIGPFSVARVVGTDNGKGDPISFHAEDAGIDIPIGRGFDTADAPPRELELGTADQNQAPGEQMRGFSPSGGFALLIQRRVRFTIPPGGGNPGETVDEPGTPFGTPLFGLQVVRYDGVDGTRLTGLDFGVDASTIPSLAGDYPTIGEIGVRRAFVTEYGGALLGASELNRNLRTQIIVVPISLPCGANQVDFLEATPAYGAAFSAGASVATERSEFAQLTHTNDAELTEWLRYDFVVSGEFVRAAPSAFISLYEAIVAGQNDGIEVNPGGGTTPGPIALPTEPVASAGAIDPATLAVQLVPLAVTSRIAALPVAPTVAPVGAAPLEFWNPELGESEIDDLPFTRALSDAFQFRGVLGTFSHDHADGTLVVPVWRASDPRGANPDRGWLGRLDPVFAVSDQLTDPGQPALVHRVWRAPTANGAPVREQVDWEPGPNLTSTAGPTTLQILFGVEWDQEQLVALDRAIGVPFLADPAPMQFDPDGNRERNRVLKYPSGEMPRLAPGLLIGSETTGGDASGAIVDEVVFQGGAAPVPGHDFRCVLFEDIDDQQDTFIVVPNMLRWDFGLVTYAGPVVDQLPRDGGLLRIGREYLFYRSYDQATGEFEVAENGRGVLGTQAGPHSQWESVVFFPSVTVSILAGGVGTDDEYFALEDPGGQYTCTRDFGYSGTFLVGDELVHHTFKDDDGLGMPRASRTPGRDDGQGAPLFRGRFGTTPEAHAAGTAVLRFPFRYWDRFAPRADAPELHHFDLQLSQPDAFLQGIVFEKDDVPETTVRLGVLQRTDSRTPWDADPDVSQDLEVVFTADPRDGLHTVGRQIDRVEWRVFTEYLAGAFDPLEGLATGWKQAPSLRRFAAQYLAPGRVIARRQR
ncbi:MAG: hypothetical protein R3F34_07985 [Planctomycetota bacterium]